VNGKELTMITVKLTEEEAVILQDIVETFIEGIRVEIMHTDKREYREMLKQQEKVVKKILDELQAKELKVAA
jgi:hypothetical protein